MSTVVLYCWCHSDSASVLLYFTFLSHLFPLPRGAGSTVPREGSTPVLLCLFLVCCGCDTSYILSVHIHCQASIYTLALCRGHSWRVRLAKQETLTPPGHLVSHLVCRGPWMSTVVLYCWYHSDSASVLLYFTFMITLFKNCIHQRLICFKITLRAFQNCKLKFQGHWNFNMKYKNNRYYHWNIKRDFY